MFKIAKEVSLCFEPRIRTRGDRYFESNHVGAVQHYDSGVSATVAGASGDYEVGLYWGGSSGEIAAECTCPYFAEGTGDLCKHLWAFVRHCDDHGWPDSLALMAETRALFIVCADGLETDEPYADDYDYSAGSDYAGIRTAAFGRDGTSWRHLLGNLAPAAHSPRTRTARQQICFVVDASESARRDRLVLRYAARQMKRDGNWSVLRFAVLSRYEPLAIDDEEQRKLLEILMTLRSADDAGGYHPMSTGVSRTEIGAPFYEIVLPRLAATGNLMWLPRAARQASEALPLSYRGDRAQHFRLEVDEDSRTWTFRGTLRRHDTSVPLEEVELLLSDGLSIHGGALARVDLGTAPQWAHALFRAGPVQLPRRERERFLESLWSTPDSVPSELPPALTLTRESVGPRGVIEIVAPRRNPQPFALAEVSFDYGGRQVDAIGGGSVIIDFERNAVQTRDAQREDVLLEALREAGFQYHPNHGHHMPYRILLTLLAPAMQTLCDGGWVVKFNRKAVHTAHGLHVATRSGIDWFDLDVSIDYGGITAHLPELLAATAHEHQIVPLPDGSHGLLPAIAQSQIESLYSLGERREDTLRYQPQQALLVDALLESRHIDAKRDRAFTAMRKRLRAFTGVRAAPQPRGFVGELRPYQLEGLSWLQALRDLACGGCLADDMGLGKTIQVLALLESLRRRRKRPRASLIVVPKSVVHNWVEEARRFTPKLDILEYTGSQRRELTDLFDRVDLIVTTYGLLRRDITILTKHRFHYAILDEAQAIKNPRSQASRAALSLRAEQRLALTGTPVENHLGDLAALFDFINPGLLGSSGALTAIANGRDDAHTATVVGAGLRPFILRRTKTQVLDDLPPKTEQTILCDLPRDQRRQYDELAAHFRDSLKRKIDRVGLKRSKIHVLEALLRLRQAACHPALIDPAKAEAGSAKLDALMAQLEDVLAGGHKALIFSQFTRFLALVRKRLEAAGIEYAYLDGRTRKREEKILRFQRDTECPLFLISLKAGGFGLNLTAADYVFILDPWWNPAVESQAIDRAHRIGQTRRVFAYRIISADTVEDKILSLQARKRALADTIVGEDNRLIQNLSAEDLQALLS